MPATSTSPVKILLDLGIDLDNLSSEEDYLSALMEASAILQASGQTDQRFKILTDEVRVVRKSRKAASPSKGMQITKKKISAASFKGGKKSFQGINKIFSAGSSQGGQGGDLLVIKEKVVSIEALLGEQYKLQEENAKDAKAEREKKKRSLKERLLEGGKNVWGGIKKVAGTILKPFKSIWTKILDFIKTVFLGKILVNIIKWGQDPKNQDKIKSIFKFLKDWWPVLLTAYLAFGNGLSKFVLGLVGKLAVWSTKLLTKVIPQLFKAIASMGPWGWAALGTAAIAGGAMYMGNKQKNERQKTNEQFDDQTITVDEFRETGETPGASQAIVETGSFPGMMNFNQGGFVSGPGGVDKVPARLTAGEFVMSKGAVQKYGTNTLASMNAAGGGTNIPSVHYNTGGPVINSSFPDTSLKFYSGGGSVSSTFRPSYSVKRPNLIQNFQGGGPVIQRIVNKSTEKLKVGEGNAETLLLAAQERTTGVNPPSKNNVVQNYEIQKQQVKKQNSSGDSTKVPNFNAEKYISEQKIKTLGL